MHNQPLKPTVYIGTFIHTEATNPLTTPSGVSTREENERDSLRGHEPIAQLVVFHDAAVFVDETGTIVHIAKEFLSPNGGQDQSDDEKNKLDERVAAEAAKIAGKAEEEKTVWTINHAAMTRDANVEGDERRKSRWWFPGFIDTHIHASQFPNAGIFGTSTLLDWLNTYTFPLESSFSSTSNARKIYNRCIDTTLSHGTTTASYYATIHPAATNLLADICLAKGQRAFVGRVCMDTDLSPNYYRDESSEQALAATRETIQHCQAIDPHRDIVCPIITPRFAPSCSPDLLQGLGRLAASSEPLPLPIQTHISENKRECALVHSLFPSHDTYAAVYDAHGLLTPRTVLAHAIHLSRPERDLIRQRGAAVSHCPVSNTSLGSGFCPVRTLLDEGVTVGLGTDVSGGYSCSILVAAREAVMVSRSVAATAAVDRQIVSADSSHGLRNSGQDNENNEDAKAAKADRNKLTVDECLHLATRGGAACLGLGDMLGGFEVGKHWDAQLVELEDVLEVMDTSRDGSLEVTGKGQGEQRSVMMAPVQVWGRESWSDRVAKWVFCGDDRNTRAVYVKGKLVHEKPT